MTTLSCWICLLPQNLLITLLAFASFEICQAFFKDSLLLEMALGQTVQAKPSARPNPRKWPKWRFRSDFPNRCYRQKTEFEHQTQNSTSVGLSEPIRSTSSSDMSERGLKHSSVQTDGQNFVLLTPLVVTQAIHVDHRLWHRVWSGPDDLPKILRIKLNLLGFLTVVPCCTHCQNLWSWYDIMCTYNQTILCTSIRCFKIKI